MSVENSMDPIVMEGYGYKYHFNVFFYHWYYEYVYCCCIVYFLKQDLVSWASMVVSMIYIYISPDMSGI